MNKDTLHSLIEQATFMKMHGRMYRIDGFIYEEEEQEVYTHNENTGEEHVTTFDELSECNDLQFFKIVPITE